MNLQLCHLLKATLLILLWIDVLAQSKDYKPTCPIGFSLFSRKDHGPLCFRRKGPETFADKYKDCVGNLYTSKLYREYVTISKPDYLVWTEYKSMHPGGLFVDWSYTKSIGEKFNSVYDVTIDSTLDLEEELCLVMDPISNYTAVKCNEKHYSFCVVKPYTTNVKTASSKRCDGLKDAVKFWSPESTCLSVLSGVGGGTVRATWNQAQELCLKKGGSLLNRGWRYINHPIYRDIGVNHIYPLGIIMSTDYSMLRYDAMSDHSEIPVEDWHFQKRSHNVDTLLGSVHDNFWDLVNGSYIFYDVICEKSVPLKNVTMQVAIDFENKLTLKVNDSLDKDDIYCFTDSVERYPVRISKSKVDDTNIFVLIPKLDGYYWCTHTDTRNYKITETKKVLFIREKRSIVNNYAIKLRHHDLYKLDDIKDLSKIWEYKIKEYIYYRNKYERVYGDLYNNATEDTLKGFKDSNPSLNLDHEPIISKIKLKRLYMDRRTVLVHVQLNPVMDPVSPGLWEGLEIVSMKPVYYCKSFDSIPQLPLGKSITTAGCRTHTCVGDFNEGVQWVTMVADNCTIKPDLVLNRALRFDDFDDNMPTVSPPTSTTVEITDANTTDSSEEVIRTRPPTPPLPTSTILIDETTYSTTSRYESTTVNYESTTVNYESTTVNYESTTVKIDLTTVDNVSTTDIPSTTATPIIRPPEQQLQQVIQNLDDLVNNGSTIMVGDIGEVFDEVDDLLEEHDNLEIPGRLLHLLDKLGSAIELNGSRSAAAVRANVALLLADAAPARPVRGLRLAARGADGFTEDAFEMLSDEPNSTVLDPEKNEVVVHLPQSVAETSQRISFVVFRNDRAFQPNDKLYSVNSRVLSIKVGEVTQFHNGEVIDIHLSPVTSNPERNFSRTCAYWEFLEDGTGFWSQEGCRLIRSKPGQLDICRCTHLTHFAEVLFPRTVFSQENEDALELLTIIGCCLSIFGVFFVGITSAMFRSWRREFNNKIWFQLCISIFLVALCFLVVIFAKFDHYNVFCMLLGVILHYSVLSSFCWMLVAAVLSYRSLVLVFTRDASHKLLRASAFSWGAPFAVIGVLLSVAPQSYSGRFEDKSPSSSFCYPSGLGLWLSVYLPIAVILLANWTLFALIVRSVFASRRIQRHGDTNEALRCASVSCLLVFLFGLPWVFGLFAFNIVAAYLFTLTATFQGFILFIFFVLGNKKTRDLWLNKLKIKQTRKVPVTSSTYSNRSNAWRAPSQNVTFEAKASKPKSLNQDDSRFS